jgi:AcrR family transcriptional regulator
MCPRPRTVSDEEIFAATARMMGELGPVEMTLARVARAAGLSPATLVQRFGSKRALLLAFARSGTQVSPGSLAADLLARSRTPLDALRSFLGGFAAMASSAKEYANHLAFLQNDLTDPEFLAITQKIVAAHDRAAERLAKAAIARGQLEPGDPKALVHLLQSVVTGSLMRWAILRKGPAKAWLARDLDRALALLGPARER